MMLGCSHIPNGVQSYGGLLWNDCRCSTERIFMKISGQSCSMLKPRSSATRFETTRCSGMLFRQPKSPGTIEMISERIRVLSTSTKMPAVTRLPRMYWCNIEFFQSLRKDFCLPTMYLLERFCLGIRCRLNSYVRINPDSCNEICFTILVRCHMHSKSPSNST